MEYPTPRTRIRSKNLPVSAEALQQRLCAPELRLEIVYRDPSELKASPRKLRRPDKRQQEHLVPNIRKFGIVLPVLIAQDLTIIRGQAIVDAAKTIGLKVPTTELGHLSEEQARALRIALHKIESLSSWNEVVLKDELQFLSGVDIQLDSFTGFSSAEIDVILNAPSKSAGDDADDMLPEQAWSEPVSRVGDVWAIRGGHRLGCLDALDPASYPTLLSSEKAGLVICDPPYNVPVRGHVTSRAGAREFPMASGEMNTDEFTGFLRTAFQHLADHAVEGSLSLQFMDWRHMDEMSAAGRSVYGSLQNLCVWTKTNAGMGSLWRSQHELCFVWKNGTGPHVNNVELGRHGRNRSNVWPYPSANTGAAESDQEAREHVTPKSVSMIQDAILDVSHRGDIVLDVFAGSCTTLIAARRAKRRGYGMELDPVYTDLGVRRMEARSGAEARHADTGKTFAEMAAERGIALRPRVRSR